MKDIPVLYCDDDVLIVNKPAGLAVQGGEGITVTVLDVLERQTGARVFPVHRLDRDTAGILVVARSSKSAAALTGLFPTGSLVKRYRAIVFGMPPAQEGLIDTPLVREGTTKDATTAYTLESSVRGHSLLALTLGTGRMHQIRSHLAGIGCPILADDKYGDFTRNKEVRKSFGIRKLQLAACSLAIPLAGSVRRFTVPLPDHMLAAAEALGLALPLTE
jgi:23S rRNA pseudouridine955/2504/2580 synthase